MDNAKCKDCQHFLQHYTFDTRRIFRVYCGHCIYANVKQKRPDSRACEHFAPGPSDTEAFVSKEYLSKELLQYVLRLPLLPEVGEVHDPVKRKGGGPSKAVE